MASNPTESRLIHTLAADAQTALAAINTAGAKARARAWELAGHHAPDHDIDAGYLLIIDLDATLSTAHSEKEDAKGTFKKTFGFHPLCAFIDHKPCGTGEFAAALLRPGNAGSNTAADHIRLIEQVLRQLPKGQSRPGKKILIRADTAGGTHTFVEFLTKRRLSYSVGFALPASMPDQ